MEQFPAVRIINFALDAGSFQRCGGNVPTTVGGKTPSLPSPDAEKERVLVVMLLGSRISSRPVACIKSSGNANLSLRDRISSPVTYCWGVMVTICCSSSEILPIRWGLLALEPVNSNSLEESSKRMAPRFMGRSPVTEKLSRSMGVQLAD